MKHFFRRSAGSLASGLLGVLMLGFLVLMNSPVWAKGKTDGNLGPLVLYTNSGGEGRADWIIEKSKAAGFDIQVLPLGGGDLVNRVIAEKNNPVADVVFGINAVDLGKLAKADLLYKFQPEWMNKIDPALAEPGGLFYAMGISPLVMFYNTNLLSPAAAPKDWIDLAVNPAFKDKYVLLGLGGGTARMIISSILIEHADPRGVYGISARGWEVMRQFIQNGHIQETGEDYFAEVVSGQYSAGELWLAGLLLRKRDYNAPHIDFVVPQKGIPYVWEGIGIIKNGKNEARTKQWVDWFGSTAVQTEWSARFGHIPTNKETYSTFSNDLRDAMAKCHPQTIDWSLATENLDKWMEKIQLEFVK